MRILVLVWACMLLTGVHASGQEITNINPSIKFIGGEPYYIHEVLEGQQLSAIATAYKSDVPSLFEVNPGLDSNLFVGQKLRIPFTDASVPIMKEISDRLREEELQRIRAEKEAARQAIAYEPPIQEVVDRIEEEQSDLEEPNVEEADQEEEIPADTIEVHGVVQTENLEEEPSVMSTTDEEAPSDTLSVNDEQPNEPQKPLEEAPLKTEVLEHMEPSKPEDAQTGLVLDGAHEEAPNDPLDSNLVQPMDDTASVDTDEQIPALVEASEEILIDSIEPMDPALQADTLRGIDTLVLNINRPVEEADSTALSDSVSLDSLVPQKEEVEEVASEIKAASEDSIQHPLPEQVTEDATIPADSLAQSPDTNTAQQVDLSALTALSESITKSLEDLKRASENIEKKPILAEDGLPGESPIPEVKQRIQPKGVAVSVLLDSVRSRYLELEDRSDTSLYLKEYFLVRVNRDGIITNVRDERTETNQNTYALDPEHLKGMHLSKSDSLLEYQNMIVALGLNAQLAEYTYYLKIKNGALKPLTKLGGDEISERAKHRALIQERAIDEGWKGKFAITVLDGFSYVSLHDQFEYNPFAISRMELDEVAIIAIAKVRSL